MYPRWAQLKFEYSFLVMKESDPDFQKMKEKENIILGV